MFKWDGTVTNPNAPKFPSLINRSWTIEIAVQMPDRLKKERVLLDTRDKKGKGVAVIATAESVRLDISDGHTQRELGHRPRLDSTGRYASRGVHR